MTRETIVEIVKRLAATYRLAYMNCPETTMNTILLTWSEALIDYTDEEGMAAFRICVKKCKTPPVPADIVDKIEKARDLKRPSKAEIWERILNAVADSKKQVFVADRGYRTLYSLRNDECKAIFNELPQSVRKCLSFEGFCNYAEMSHTALSVERARFMKEIDEIREAVREQKQISTSELMTINNKRE